MTAREVMGKLKKDGWYQVGSKGSHIQFKHLIISGKITVPAHSGDLNIKTLRSIEKMAQWR